MTAALALTGCGAPAAQSPAPQPSPPVETATPKPSPTGGPPNVYTDYSKLEERDDAPRLTVYTRWYGAFTDHLIPSEDYGPLIPFDGTLVADAWSDGSYALQGLITLDGKVVVDPVYAGINRLCAPYAWDLTSPETYFPAFVLSRYAGDGENLFGGHRDLLSRLCAADGSWITQREYRFPYDLVCYGMVIGSIFGLRDDNVLVMLDMDTGEETFAVTLDGLDEEALSNALSCAAYGDGRVTTHATCYDSGGYLRTSAFYCWDENGNEIPLPADVSDLSYGFSEGLCPARQSSSGLWGYLGVDGEWAIPPQFSDVWNFSDGVALLGTHAHQLIDRQGNVLYETPVYDHCQKTGDYWYFTGYSGDAGLVLDREGNEVASPALHGGYVNVLDYGWAVMDQPDRSQLLIRGVESWPIPAMWSDLMSWNVTEDAIFLSYFGEYAPGDRRPRWLMWRPEDGDIPHLYDPRVRVGSFSGLSTDPITGERYFTIHNDDGTYSVYTLDGETIFDGLDFRPRLYGGRCLTSRSENGRRTVELLDENGDVLFYRQWENPFD